MMSIQENRCVMLKSRSQESVSYQCFRSEFLHTDVIPGEVFSQAKASRTWSLVVRRQARAGMTKGRRDSGFDQ